MSTRFTFESDASSTYLVYRPGREEKVDPLTLGMLTHGNMDGLCRRCIPRQAPSGL